MVKRLEKDFILNEGLDGKLANLRECCQNIGVDFRGSVFYNEQRELINTRGKIYISKIDPYQHTTMVIIDAKMENGKNILTVGNCTDVVYCVFGNYRGKHSGLLNGISVINSEKILDMDRIVFRFSEDKTEIEMNNEGACSVNSFDYEDYSKNNHLRKQIEKYVSDIQKIMNLEKTFCSE